MSLARCLRCEQVYCLEVTEVPGEHTCRYHSGKYRRWWSCCRELTPDAPGCRTGFHVEDKSATAMLDSIALQFVNQQGSANQPEVIIFESPEGSLSVAQSAAEEMPQPVAAESTEPAAVARATHSP